jgi:hypothetical protein
MAKFYAVELRTTAIVQVNDDHDELFAEQAAADQQSDIVSDAKHNSFEIFCIGEIRTLADLELHGWDGECIPYNGDGNTRLNALLPPAPEKRGWTAEDLVERCAWCEREVQHPCKNKYESFDCGHALLKV